MEILKIDVYPDFTALKYVASYRCPPFLFLSRSRLALISLSSCLSRALCGHVTQQQTCGNCSDAVKLKASPEPQRKQQKETLEQPPNVDTNQCICQADLDVLKTALSLTIENCHHTTYCFLRDRKADGFDIVKCTSPLQICACMCSRICWKTLVKTRHH